MRSHLRAEVERAEVQYGAVVAALAASYRSYLTSLPVYVSVDTGALYLTR